MPDRKKLEEWAVNRIDTACVRVSFRVRSFAEAVANRIADSAGKGHRAEDHVAGLGIESAKSGVELLGELMWRVPGTPCELSCTTERCAEFDVRKFSGKHQTESLPFVRLCGFGETNGKIGEIAFDQDELCARRVVAQTDARRGQCNPLSIAGKHAVVKEIDWSGDFAYLVGGDCTGAIDHHRILIWIEDGGLDAVLSWSRVENCVDLAIKIFEDVRCGCGADVAEDVGAGRCYGNTSLADDFKGNGMSR